MDITLQSQMTEMDTFVNKNSSESTESSHAEDESDASLVTWTGKRQHMMTSLDQTGHFILEEMKKPSAPNIEQFPVLVGEIKKEKSRGSVSWQEIAHLMEHDLRK